MPLITLTTDFGAGEYVAQVKGVILSLLPGATIVDISHDIPPGDVRAAAYVLEVSIPAFPPDSVHLAVVDPGVGTPRRALAARFAGRTFVAPDNGCLTAFLDGPAVVHEVTNEGLFLPEVSPTFHGRDVFAPVAAHLAAGRPLADVGPELVDDPVSVEDLKTVTDEGVVLHTDRFGNLVTSFQAERLAGAAGLAGEGTSITERAETFGAASGEGPFLYEGSGGRIEVAVPNGSAAAALGWRNGTPVRLERNG
jgi:S-adenosylmethionine hydrolase